MMPGLIYHPPEDGRGQAKFTHPGFEYTEPEALKLRELRQQDRERLSKIKDSRVRHKYRRIGGEGDESTYWNHQAEGPLAEGNNLSRNMSTRINNNVTQDLMVPAVEWRRRINTVQDNRSRNLGISRINASTTHELAQRRQHKTPSAAVVPRIRG
jgi:hypothetical protein